MRLRRTRSNFAGFSEKEEGKQAFRSHRDPARTLVPALSLRDIQGNRGASNASPRSRFLALQI
jgi:hypothetical protein